MITVLSPHLDDAVLSCWHLLAAEGDVTVVNVFGGMPEPGVTLSWWDAMSGAHDSAARMGERLEEDRAALALAGRAALTLEFAEELYRSNGARPDVGSQMAELIPADAVVYAPAGLGIQHADHLLTRDAALALRAGGREVRLYADLPHAHLLATPAGNPDPTPWWDATFRGHGIAPERLVRRVHRLGDEMFERKIQAVHEYRSQLSLLERYLPFGDLRWEVTWEFLEPVAP